MTAYLWIGLCVLGACVGVVVWVLCQTAALDCACPYQCEYHDGPPRRLRADRHDVKDRT